MLKAYLYSDTYMLALISLHMCLCLWISAFKWNNGATLCWCWWW